MGIRRFVKRRLRDALNRDKGPIPAPASRGQTASDPGESADNPEARAEKPTVPGFEVFVRSESIANGKAAIMEIHGTLVAVYRIDGELFAIDQACTHEDGPLGEAQDIEGTIISCPYHDWRFDLRDGSCLTNPKRPVACYDVREEKGWVLVGAQTSEGSPERGGDHDDGLEMNT